MFSLLISMVFALAGMVTHLIMAPAQAHREGPRIEFPTNQLAQKYLDQLIPRGGDLNLAACYGFGGLMYVILLPQDAKQGELAVYFGFMVMQTDQIVLSEKSGIWQLRSLKKVLKPEQQDSFAFDHMIGEDAVALEFGKIMAHQPVFTMMRHATIDSIPQEYERQAAVQHVGPPQCP